MKEPMSEEEKRYITVEAGREMGMSWMQSAVAAAKNNEELNTNMFAIRVACIHVLTMLVYNDMNQLGMKREDSITDYIAEINGELDMVLETEENVYKAHAGGRTDADSIN